MVKQSIQRQTLAERLCWLDGTAPAQLGWSDRRCHRRYGRPSLLHPLHLFVELYTISGASGVGKAIVDILDTKSVSVVVLDRSLPAHGSAQYNDVSFYECDVSSYAKVQEVAEQIRKEVTSLLLQTRHTERS